MPYLVAKAMPSLVALAVVLSFASAAEPPALNPFAKSGTSDREDLTPGYVELSDGSVHAGQVYLTRDKRLKIYDDKLRRQREIPLRAVKQIECTVKKEWIEKEWRFKELANDEKMYTGRSYPAREYLHTVTLQDDRTITGPLSGIVYVQPQVYTPQGPNEYRPEVDPEQFIFHKRQKGDMGTDLKSLIYVKLIKLGDEAYAEGRDKASAAQRTTKPAGKSKKAAKKRERSEE